MIDDDEESTTKEFHLWKLLAWLLGVILTLMAAAAAVDLAVLGW